MRPFRDGLRQQTPSSFAKDTSRIQTVREWAHSRNHSRQRVALVEPARSPWATSGGYRQVRTRPSTTTRRITSTTQRPPSRPTRLCKSGYGCHNASKPSLECDGASNDWPPWGAKGRNAWKRVNANDALSPTKVLRCASPREAQVHHGPLPSPTIDATTQAAHFRCRA